MRWAITLFIACSIANAEPLAHVGVSAGLNGVLYTLCTGAMNRDVGLRPGCLVTSSVLTGMVGLVSEVNSAGPVVSLDGHDLAMDAIGIGTSALIIYLLDIRGKKQTYPEISFSGNNVTIGWRW